MHIQKRSLLLLALMLLLFAGMSQTAHAQGPVGTVPTGTTVEADAFLAAPDVIVDGDINGDLFAAGQSVTLNGNVTGSVFILADRATIRGNVGGSVYTLASTLSLDSTAKIAHSAYVITLSLQTAAGSMVERDLYTLSLGAQLGGQVARTTRAVIGPVEIIRLLMTQVESLRPLASESMATPPTSTDSAFAASASACSTQTYGVGAAAGFIGNAIECLLNPPAQSGNTQTGTQPAPNNAAVVWGMNRLREFVVLALIGILLSLVMPRLLQDWSTPLAARPWASALVGLFAAVNGFLITIILIIFVVALGFAFQGLTLGSLAGLTWTLGLSLISLAFSVFILFLFYISQIVVANWVALWALNRFAPKTKLHRLIPLLVGILVLVLLSAIPYLGAVISIVAALLGLGGITLVTRDHWFANRKPQATKQATA